MPANPLVALLLMPVLYVLSRVAGRVIERHYSDVPELLGVSLLGACLLLPFALAMDGATGTLVRVALALAVVGGLFTAPRAV